MAVDEEKIKTVGGGIYAQVRDAIGFTDTEMKLVIVFAVVGTAVLAYILYERNNRRKKSAEVRDKIRQMKDAVRRSVETLDSRTQWVFQEDDELAPAKRLYKKLSDLEKKWDWNLTGRYNKRKDEMEEARALLVKWVENKPNYNTKEDYLRNMEKVGNILKRW
ncbi:MAG: hypothetical protein QF829_04795 [Candidatus Hydrothermarchaeota archaeon]|jgi:hypothetical protein|nr:hypothetical protein [Candidatus Hydrothermarchaeota archaeon]